MYAVEWLLARRGREGIHCGFKTDHTTLIPGMPVRQATTDQQKTLRPSTPLVVKASLRYVEVPHNTPLLLWVRFPCVPGAQRQSKGGGGAADADARLRTSVKSTGLHAPRNVSPSSRLESCAFLRPLLHEPLALGRD